MLRPPYLQSGDSIYILSTARKVSNDIIMPFVHWIEQYHITCILGSSMGLEDNQYAGNDDQRAADFQEALDREDVQAIWFAGGGYGSIRVFDKINWDQFVESPKWLIGFSDITIWHNLVNQFYAIQTLHALMPKTFKDAPQDCLNATQHLLFGKMIPIQFPISPYNNQCTLVSGEIIGGNLSILYSLLGTKSGFNVSGKILFIEDVGEYLYHIDRMMIALKSAGKLEGLKALVVGQFSDMMDNQIPFGKTYQEIIKEHTSGYGYPLIFDFPAGHIDRNMPIIFGAQIRITNLGSDFELIYI
jgi:muramoyltetrapeptide carboxypeptidase